MSHDRRGREDGAYRIALAPPFRAARCAMNAGGSAPGAFCDLLPGLTALKDRHHCRSNNGATRPAQPLVRFLC